PADSEYNVYGSRRIWFEAAATNPERPYTATLGGGVAAAVPLVLEADAEGTLPHRPQPDEPASGEAAFSGNDRATRLAAVALGWNVLQHFYPYFDLVSTDWEGALGKALEAAATDRDEADFLKTLRRMVAALHDGHGRVFHASERSFRCLPIAWKWVED